MDTPTAQPIELAVQRRKAAIKPLVLSWASLLLGPLSLVLLPILLWGIGRCLARRAGGPLLALLLLSPLGVSFAAGVLDYLGGSPTCRVTGGLRRFTNPDRITRCTTTGGCIGWGHEWALEMPHNLGVYLMAVTFGPPRHAYDGPYPTEEEALQLVAPAAPTPTEVVLSGKVQVNGQEILLGQQALSRLLAHSWYYQAEMDGQPLPELRVRATLHEGRCLIVGLNATVPRTDNTPGTYTRTILLLVDARNQKPFAFYQPSHDQLPD